MLVTKEYVDYLKRHVDWEVMDYEENPFRGYTVEEAADFLGMADLPYMESLDFETTLDLEDGAPTHVDWREKAPKCVNGVRNQGHCGSCWAFGTVGMLASRCCIKSGDFKLLSTQELVGCV
jgi:C1A family cysteine protease